GLTAPAALARLGAGARALPHTMAQPSGRQAWTDPPLETLPDTEQAIADALALARLLPRLPGGRPHPFTSAPSATAALTAPGANTDRPSVAFWWEAPAPASPPPRRYGARRAAMPLPRLLAGTVAAAAWMTCGITDRPEPVEALLAAFGRLVG